MVVCLRRWREGEGEHLTWLHQQPGNAMFSPDALSLQTRVTLQMPPGPNCRMITRIAPALSSRIPSLAEWYSTNHDHPHNHTPFLRGTAGNNHKPFRNAMKT